MIPISPKCANLTLVTQVMSCAKIQATTWSNIDLMQWRKYTSPCLNDQLFQIFLHIVPLHTCSWYTYVTLTSCDMIIWCKIFIKTDAVIIGKIMWQSLFLNKRRFCLTPSAKVWHCLLISGDDAWGEYNFNAFRPSHEMNEYIVLYQTPLACSNTRYRYLKVRLRQISNVRD